MKEKHFVNKQKMMSRIQDLTQKNIFANDIISKLSSEELDVEKWVKRNVFGL